MFVQAGVRRNDSRSEESEEELSEGDLMQVNVNLICGTVVT